MSAARRRELYIVMTGEDMERFVEYILNVKKSTDDDNDLWEQYRELAILNKDVTVNLSTT